MSTVRQYLLDTLGICAIAKSRWRSIVPAALPPAHSSEADIDRTSTGLVHRIKG
jgi:hypothetical protein